MKNKEIIEIEASLSLLLKRFTEGAEKENLPAGIVPYTLGVLPGVQAKLKRLDQLKREVYLESLK